MHYSNQSRSVEEPSTTRLHSWKTEQINHLNSSNIWVHHLNISTYTWWCIDIYDDDIYTHDDRLIHALIYTVIIQCRPYIIPWWTFSNCHRVRLSRNSRYYIIMKNTADKYTCIDIYMVIIHCKAYIIF